MYSECLSNDEQLYVGPDLTCPICTEIMLPPIKRCIFGHSFCRLCKEKIDKCPICRADKNGGRNYLMERTVKTVPVPCRYMDKGCTVEKLGSFIRSHQEFCQFSTKRCPLRTINSCGWVGQMKDIAAHAKEKHAANMFSTPRVQFLCPKFQDQALLKPNRPADNYHLLFKAHGHLFKCIWDINTTTRFTRWCVVFLGPRTEATNYYYNIKFENREHPELEMETIERRGFCQPSHMKRTQKYNFISIDVDDLLGLIGSRGLYYTISIHKCNEWSQVFSTTQTQDLSFSGRSCFVIPKVSICIDEQDPIENEIGIFFRELEAEDADDEMDNSDVASQSSVRFVEAISSPVKRQRN